jgi:hypothetical protein
MVLRGSDFLVPGAVEGSADLTRPRSARARQRANQSRLGRPQLVAMCERKLHEQSLGAWCQVQLHLAPVAAVPRAPDPPPCFQSAAQLDGAVMADLHKLRQHSDSGLDFAAFDRQQRLMLLRLDARRARRAFAEIQKAPYLVAKISQRRIINRLCLCLLQRHNYIVLRYKSTRNPPIPFLDSRPAALETRPVLACCHG